MVVGVIHMYRRFPVVMSVKWKTRAVCMVGCRYVSSCWVIVLFRLQTIMLIMSSVCMLMVANIMSRTTAMSVCSIDSGDQESGYGQQGFCL